MRNFVLMLLTILLFFSVVGVGFALLPSEGRSLTHFSGEFAGDKLIVEVTCSTNNTLGDLELKLKLDSEIKTIKVFDGKGNELTNGKLVCGTTPTKYRLEIAGEAFETENTYNIVGEINPACGVCLKEIFIYYEKAPQQFIPDNNLIVMIIMLVFVVGIIYKKKNKF